MKYDMKQYNRINNRPTTRKRLNESMSNSELDWCRCFCNYFNVDKDTAKYMYRFWDADVYLMLDIDDNNNIIYCTACDALLMIAWMLIDDGYDKYGYTKLGHSNYMGDNSPYSYSWFDGEDYSGKSVYELYVKWINTHPVHWSKIYNIVKNNIDNFDDKKIFEFWQHVE